MFNGNWKVKIKADDMTLNYSVWIWQEINSGKIEVLYLPDEVKTFERGVDVLPSFKLPEGVLQPFLKALSELNIKLPEESFVKGKLKATEYHLEDLRKMLNLSIPSTERLLSEKKT